MQKLEQVLSYFIQSNTKSRLTTLCLVETMQKPPGQKAEERKDFRQKGGYQGGFGINSSSWPGKTISVELSACF
jgi:hypothetical protein